MHLSKNNNHKLALLALMISMSFSSNIFASELSWKNNNSTPSKQPTEIVSSDGKINLNNANEELKINNATNNPANLIIAEVISAEKSNINGNIAILGNNKPQLIIANPNGINCSDHCSFSNIDRVSLITYPFENNIPSNHLTDNITEKHIHFKNIKHGKFTDAKTIQLLARAIKLESSQLNVNDITIAVHDTHFISNILTTINNINATKFINITDDILPNIILAKNAKLTIDGHSAINSKHSHFTIKNGIFNNAGILSSKKNSHYEVINGEFYNSGSINNNEILVITGSNATIDNQANITAKNSHFLIRNGKFNNNGKIKNTELIEIFGDNATINNQSKIDSKIGLYEIKNGTFYNSGIIDHAKKVTIKGNNAYINNQLILISAKYDLTKLKSSKFFDYSFVLPHKRNADNNVELNLSKNIM